MSSKEKLLYFPPKNFSNRFGDQFFTAEIVSHRLASDETACCQKSVVLYKIVVKRGRKEWFVEKRYSDFIKLWDSLPLTPKFFASKVIPPKTWFSVATNTEFLLKRQEKLFQALDESLKDLSSTNSLSRSPALDFLNLNSSESVNEGSAS